MPMLFRTSRLSVGAAISLAAACGVAASASTQVPAPVPLLIGPDRVGSAVTYRLTTSGGRAGNAPNVQMLALRWKLGQKIVVTLTSPDDVQATAYVATRAADGTLVLDNVSADDPEGQRVAIAVGVLNRLDGFVAAAPAGAKTWKTSLVVQPPGARATPGPDAANAPAPQSTRGPQPLNIPVAATRSDDETGTTLAATGSADRTVTRPAGSGSRGGGGGMGGGGMGRRGGMGGMGGMGGGMGGMGGGMGGMGGGMGGMGGGRMGGSSSGPKSIKVTTKITVNAHFGRDGALTTGTIAETTQSAGDQSQQNQPDQPSDQSQQNPQSEPMMRSWEIERTP
jgi:hypothetical protein